MAFTKITRRKIFAFFGGSSILAALITTRLKHHKNTPTGILFSDPQSKLLNTTEQQRAGAYLLFSLTGTTTPANVYADALLTMPLSQVPGAAQPSCTADSAGCFNPIYMDPAITYRVQMYIAKGVKLEDMDPYVPHGIANQATLAALLNPQTAAELAAGVTPLQYQYPPYDSFRYMTPAQVADVQAGTALLDVTAALQTLFTLCGSNGQIARLRGTQYKVSSALTFAGNGGGIWMEGAGASAAFGAGTGQAQLNFTGTGYIGLTVTGIITCFYVTAVGTGNVMDGIRFGISAASSNILLSKIDYVRVVGLAGFGVQINDCWDCLFDTISVQSCGSASKWAFSVNQVSSGPNESTFSRLQVELSTAQAIKVDFGVYDCTFPKIHSERTTGDGVNPTHILGGDSCLFGMVRIEATSNVLLSLTGYNCDYQVFRCAGTNVQLNSAIAGTYSGNRIGHLVCNNFNALSTNRGPFDVYQANITGTLTPSFQGAGLLRFTFSTIANVAPAGTTCEFIDCNITGTWAFSGNNVINCFNCVLANFPAGTAATVSLSKCTVTNAFSTGFGQIISPTQCTFNGLVTIASSAKWKSDQCNFAAGITLGAGSPGWAFGPNDYVSGGAVSAGFNASPTGASWVVGERGYNIQPTVGQPKSRVCTVAGTPGTHTSEGNL